MSIKNENARRKADADRWLAIRTGRSSGAPLSASLRRFFESRLDTDLSAVTIHVSELAGQWNSAAFTLGSQIVFHPSAWNPDTRAGLRLLGHELTHVIQQREGRAVGPCADDVTLLADRALEAEADRVADDIIHGRRPRMKRRAKTTGGGFTAPVIQRQKWGWLGQRILEEGAATVGPADGSDRLEKNDLQKLKDVDDNGKPKDAKVIRYNSTATLNETYPTRAEAWERAVELAGAVAKISVLWPAFVYYVGPSADESSIPSADTRLLVDGLAAEPPGHSHNRVWVNYKPGNKPDAAGMGFYYEYRQDCRGGALLIVEHTQDPQAIVYTRRSNGGVPEETVNPTKHFHVAFYRREVGSRYMYLPLDQHYPGKEYGPYNIAKTAQMESRAPYDIKFLPSHHIYYLAD